MAKTASLAAMVTSLTTEKDITDMVADEKSNSYGRRPYVKIVKG